MDLFPLQIFPEGTAAVSITTTVYIGVCIVVFFNLRLGWPLSGLIVPGYLVPLLIAKPFCAGVTIFEAILTYLIAILISEKFNKSQYWCSLFGRDRFFLLVLISILVRAAMDGWILPAFGEWMNRTFHLKFDYIDHLHSYGLIVVSLIANFFWKPGVIKGMTPFVVTVGCTFVVLRFGIIEYTNFNISGLQHVYETIASSMMASPKSYIILVITAYFASWMNLRYSWDFNGILVPGLLALQWYNPEKILVSFLEAIVILIGASLASRLPFLQRMTIEGGRKILLYFTITFLYRYILAILIPILLPELKITDSFGLGYLLSTLLALKASGTKKPILVSRATLQVSAVGAVFGSLIGFSLSSIPLSWNSEQGPVAARNITTVSYIAVDWKSQLQADRPNIYHQLVADSYQPMDEKGLKLFQDALRLLKNSSSQDRRAYAAQLLSQIGLELLVLNNDTAYIRDKVSSSGRGIFCFKLYQEQYNLIVSPFPLDEKGSFETSCRLIDPIHANAIAIGGVPTKRLNPSFNLFGNQSALSVFANEFHCNSTVIVRASSQLDRGPVSAIGSGSDKLIGIPVGHRKKEPLDLNKLVVKGSLPQEFSLKELTRFMDLEVVWETHRSHRESPNVRDPSSEINRGYLRNGRELRGVATLWLAVDPTKNLVIDSLAVLPSVERIEFNDFYKDAVSKTAKVGTNVMVPATLGEMLFLDRHVVTPICKIVNSHKSIEEFGKGTWRQIAEIRHYADSVDLQLRIIRDESDYEYIVLVDNEQKSRHWGFYIYRLGECNESILEYPSPSTSMGMDDLYLTLFQSLKSRSLFVSGATSLANFDGSSNVTKLQNKSNAFHCFHQVTLRELGAVRKLVLQIAPIEDNDQCDGFFASTNSCNSIIDSVDQSFESWISRKGWDLVCLGQDGTSASIDRAKNLQEAAIFQYENTQFRKLWIAKSARLTANSKYENLSDEQRFNRIGIQSVTGDLRQYIHSYQAANVRQNKLEMILSTLDTYSKNEDIRVLYRISSIPGIEFRRLIDPVQRETYFVLIDENTQRLYGIIKPELVIKSRRYFYADDFSSKSVGNFLSSPFTIMILGGPQ